MADESNVESKITALSQKIEKESRFTRSLVVVCTAAILGVSLVPVKLMLSDLPNLMVNEFMNRMETIHMQWKVLDKLPHGGSGGAGQVVTP